MSLVLTSIGRDFVLCNDERKLRAGKFVLPKEVPWHDRWPWKQWWLPMAAAVVTFLALEAVKAVFLSRPAQHQVSEPVK